MTAKNQKLAILNYHGLESHAGEYAWLEEDKPYVLPADYFSLQLDEITGKGFLSLSLLGLRQWAEGKGPEKSVMITFDDGLISHFDYAAPLLKKRNLKGLFFVPAQLVGQKGQMGWNELKMLIRDGLEIGSHGLQHRPLTGLPEAELRAEFEVSKKTLEQNLGIPVKSFSIPRGCYTDTMQEMAKRAGYEYLFTSDYDVNFPGMDLYYLKRLVVKKSTTPEQFTNLITGNLGLKRQWEKLKTQVRGAVPFEFYDSLAAIKRKVLRR